MAEQGTTHAVVCEESSDDGNLLQQYTVCRLGVSIFSRTAVPRPQQQPHQQQHVQPQRVSPTKPESGRAVNQLSPPQRPPLQAPPKHNHPPQQPPKPFTLGELLRNRLNPIAEETPSTCTDLRRHNSHNNNSNSYSNNYSNKDEPDPSLNNSSSTLSFPSRLPHSLGRKTTGNPSLCSNDDSFYTRTGAPDSNYSFYDLDVARHDNDRAANLVLFLISRPHMRAFHLSWLSFFVSFFTWFAMTPLLGEIGRSLPLTRQELFMSSVLAVLSSCVTRMVVGPLNDRYGARWVMCVTLVSAAIPTALAGWLVRDRASLYWIRLLIGVAGSSFVTCQYWTLSMFTKEIAGTANALAAGWGNLGGGVAQVVIGSLLFPLFKMIYGDSCFGCGSDDGNDNEDNAAQDYDRPSDLSWRTILVFPAVLSLAMAVVVIRYGDDTPKGNLCQLQSQQESHAPPCTLIAIWENFRQGATNFNTFLLSFQYACSFGVEITMTQAAALYFVDEFGQSTESAAAIASVFGWMNLFFRGFGGFCSDWANEYSGLRGRLWCQLGLLLIEGFLVIVFSFVDSMGAAIAVMAVFSMFVQAAEGSTFGIVPYVDSTVLGSVAGFVGAGGNLGGACFAFVFAHQGYQKAFQYMGITILVGAVVTAFITISGHRSLLSGKDSDEILEHRNNAKPPAIIFIHQGNEEEVEEETVGEF